MEKITNSSSTVTLVESMGSDLSIVNAARQSFGARSDEMDERDRGLIGFLMRERHGTPFEAVVFTFQLEVPIFTARQIMRHRMASFNELSLRYKTIEESHYVPLEGDVRARVGKPGAYSYEKPSNPLFRQDVVDTIRKSQERAFADYEFMLSQGVAPEQARGVLPLGTITTLGMTLNLRSLFNFLSLRNAPEAQLEIREAALSMEELATATVPIAMAAFHNNGRTAP